MNNTEKMIFLNRFLIHKFFINFKFELNLGFSELLKNIEVICVCFSGWTFESIFDTQIFIFEPFVKFEKKFQNFKKLQFQDLQFQIILYIKIA